VPGDLRFTMTVAGHTRLRRLAGIPAFVHQLPLLRGWGCAAGRSLWRREAQAQGRRAGARFVNWLAVVVWT